MTRTVATWIVLVVAGLLLLLSSFAVWVNRVALNSDVFVDTSTELIEDDAIRTAVATRAVDELFGSVDVEAEIEDQLPEDFQSLSSPATAGLRELSDRVAERALEEPRVQRLWALSLEASHEELVSVLEGGRETVATEDGVVTLDLEQIVLEAADRIGLRDELEDKLPEDAGRIEILRSDELETAQDGFQVLKALVWVLPIFAIVAFGLAVWIAGDRRHAVRRIGITVLVVGVIGLVARNIVGTYIVDSLVAETQNRTAAGNAWDIVSELLRHSFRWFIVIGIAFLVAAWLAGPGRRAVGVRRVLAPAVRERVWAYGGLALLALILLLTGPVSDLTRYVVVLVLVVLGAVWIEALRSQILREHPNASAPELFAETRSRLATWWIAQRAQIARARPQPVQEQGGSVAARLAELADLHARGVLTDDEFASAKARTLAGD